MSETIAQRQLRNDSGDIMRRVEAGESFVVTRNGRRVAVLTPHPDTGRRRLTAGELQEKRRREGPWLDLQKWYDDRAADDLIFGEDRIEY
ncbi:MAG: type II toxin-antitoxin system prevent-host-death family antitoxin [Pseudonocardia sp.]|nr:type II toxin-antitoxin system prevent-host-death family antitoxin [Pseudonocardia sp.]